MTERARAQSGRGSGLASRLPQAYAALLFLLYGMLIALHRTPPLLGDLSNWAYSGELLARHLHGLPDPFHTLKHYPVPNSTLTVAIGVLSAAIPLAAALKVLLLLYLALCFAATLALARAAESSPLVWLIAPTGFFLSVNFWYGFLAFQIAVAVLFFFVAELLRAAREVRSPRPVKLGLLLLLLFFTHMVPFTFACLLLLFFCLQTGRHRLLGLLAGPAVLLVLYVAGRLLDGNVDAGALPPSLPHSAAFHVGYKINTLLKSFGLVNPTAVDATGGQHSLTLQFAGKPVFVALASIAVLVCSALMGVYLRGSGLFSRAMRYPFLWLASVLALAAYLVMPLSLLGISDPGSRILQTVLWLGLFLCLRDEPAGKGLAAVAAAGSAVLGVAGLVCFVVFPWQPVRPAADGAHLPSAMELLARAPFDYAVGFLNDASEDRWDDEVFPTGILVNRGTHPPRQGAPQPAVR